MYIINKETNRIEKIETATFKQLGFKEREHLQEWIANNPSCLNEDLLIIQKEFDGFNVTSERSSTSGGIATLVEKATVESSFQRRPPDSAVESKPSAEPAANAAIAAPLDAIRKEFSGIGRKPV